MTDDSPPFRLNWCLFSQVNNQRRCDGPLHPTDENKYRSRVHRLRANGSCQLTTAISVSNSAVSKEQHTHAQGSPQSFSHASLPLARRDICFLPLTRGAPPQTCLPLGPSSPPAPPTHSPSSGPRLARCRPYRRHLRSPSCSVSG